MELPPLDYRAAQFWMNALQFMGLIALFVHTHYVNKSKANASAISTVRTDLEAAHNQLGERMTRCERRQDVLESKLDGVPTHQDLSKVYERLNDVAEDLSGARGQMKALSQQLSLVNQYLLSNRGDRL